MTKTLTKTIAVVCLLAFIAIAHSDESLNVSELKGSVVLLDFWASWCKPCRESLPWMNSLQAEFPSLRIVAVNVDTDRQAAEQFLEEFKPEFEIAYDPNGRLAAEFGVYGMPTSFLLNTDGEIVDQLVGFNVSHTGKLKDSIREQIGL